ncbi:MAG: OsmC family protein [Actinomycetota bacterium]
MIQEHDYQLDLQTTDGLGELTGVDDELPTLAVTSPPEFGGPGGRWSPEHLFVASVATCLMTTFRAIATNSKLEYLEYSDRPTGHMERDESGLYRMSSVTLRPRVTISDPEQADKTHRLLEKAERACLISRSLQAEVRLEPTVETAQHASSG